MLYTQEGSQALRKYSSETIFYHYDGWDDDPIDEHSGHPLLCREAAVLTNIYFYGDEAIKKLSDLGIFSSNVESTSVNEKIEVLTLIDLTKKVLVKGGDCRSRISLFYPFTNLRNEDVGLNYAPENSIFSKWSDRQSIRTQLEILHVKQPPGDCIDDWNDVERYIGDLIGLWLLKCADSAPKIVKSSSENNFDFGFDFSTSSWTIEDVITSPKNAPSPNLTWLIPKDENSDPIFLFAADQIIDSSRFLHVGNRFPSSISSSFIDECRELATPILSELRGIDSVVGIDFIFDENWQPIIVDINPRFNSCTFPGLAFDQLVERENRVGHYRKIANNHFSTLSDIYNSANSDSLWFTPESKKGVILFAPQGTTNMSAFRALIIGDSDTECEEMHEQLLTLITRNI